MTFIFGHLLGGWLLGRLVETASKKRLSHYEWIIVMLGALLPDLDFGLDWLLGLKVHRTFTHSLVFMAGCILIIITLVQFLHFFKVSSHSGISKIVKSVFPINLGISLAIGIFSHFILDMSFGEPGIPLFWPLNYGVWFFGIKEFGISGLLDGPTARLITIIKFMIAEMLIAAIWFGWLMLSKRIDLSRNNNK